MTAKLGYSHTIPYGRTMHSLNGQELRIPFLAQALVFVEVVRQVSRVTDGGVVPAFLGR